jgi:hypothetical protein
MASSLAAGSAAFLSASSSIGLFDRGVQGKTKKESTKSGIPTISCGRAPLIKRNWAANSVTKKQRCRLYANIFTSQKPNNKVQIRD